MLRKRFRRTHKNENSYFQEGTTICIMGFVEPMKSENELTEMVKKAKWRHLELRIRTLRSLSNLILRLS